MEVDSSLYNFFFSNIREKSIITPAEWASKNVFLDGAMSSSPGFYDLAKTPYAEDITNFIYQDKFRELYVMKSSRVGITEACLNIIRFMAVNDPGHVLLALDTDDEVRKLNEESLRPSLRDLMQDVSFNDKSKLGLKTLRLPGMTVYLTGGGSATAFENKWVKLVIMDEIENHELNKHGKVSTISLARQRIKDVPGGKLIVIGKPQKKYGIMHKHFLNGTREYIEVPCAHCGYFQVLRWQGLVFPEKSVKIYWVSGITSECWLILIISVNVKFQLKIRTVAHRFTGINTSE